ncbi:hypothetical protein Saso_42800 [Streptomyces asoensis]|uniref:Uncharacterized protein n=1 Tax=Streptomyces asoensis TaxID=249586 RepID=A0ABQ3S3C5_9ACTN|nr:hypothetical protein GCM10010496_53130 [Streptomyces asoensis]GHI62630.1 hypothetical protein Saso_42800 [Streptomyces asoensis]
MRSCRVRPAAEEGDPRGAGDVGDGGIAVSLDRGKEELTAKLGLRVTAVNKVHNIGP